MLGPFIHLLNFFHLKSIIMVQIIWVRLKINKLIFLNQFKNQFSNPLTYKNLYPICRINGGWYERKQVHKNYGNNYYDSFSSAVKMTLLVHT